MSLEEIEVHFDQMKKVSEKLAEAAGEIRKLAKEDGMETIAGVKASWNSSNADIFTGKEMKRIDAICEVTDDFQKIADDILRNAKRSYEAESRNAMIARTRAYL